MKFPGITLALLAGGNASRMGGANKALLKINGSTFVANILSELGVLFPKTIIIANESKPYTQWGVPIYPDIYKDKGPLGGLHSALANALTHLVFVVSCDMPLANARIALQIVETAQAGQCLAYVPRVNNLIEPLFAAYNHMAINPLTIMLDKGYNPSVRALLSSIPTKLIDLPNTPETLRCFTNINTPSDYWKMINC